MDEIYFLSSDLRTIEDKKYYRITILDVKNEQVFTFYRIADTKAKNFCEMHKRFDNISNALIFVIKRNNRISFDIK